MNNNVFDGTASVFRSTALRVHRNSQAVLIDTERAHFNSRRVETNNAGTHRNVPNEIALPAVCCPSPLSGERELGTCAWQTRRCPEPAGSDLEAQVPSGVRGRATGDAFHGTAPHPARHLTSNVISEHRTRTAIATYRCHASLSPAAGRGATNRTRAQSQIRGLEFLTEVMMPTPTRSSAPMPIQKGATSNL